MLIAEALIGASSASSTHAPTTTDGTPSAATAAGGVRLLNVYGVTECCVYQACRAVSGPADRRLLGPPLGGTSLLLRAPLAPASDPGEEPREVLPGSGELAELWLAGPQVGLGYLAPHPPRAGAGAGGGEEEARFRHLGAHGWCFRTGDVVVCSASGLELRGRKDSQVKVRGQRVELGEIEEVLLGGAPELVRQAAAVLHAPDGGLLALWCVAPAGEEESARGGGDDATAALRSRVLREVARAGLPGHMVPARFVFVPELPITASGKVSRRELLRQGLPPVLPPASGAGGGSGGGGRLQDGWEELVAEVWAQELGLPEAPLELGRGANFGELGGHSLLALQVCKSLAQRVREGEGGSASSVSGIVTDAETGGEFGELLGALAPVELLARQDLGEYASHLRGAFGPRPAAVLGGGGGGGEEAEEGAVKVERGGASLLASAASAGCLGAVRVLLRLLSSSALTPPPLPAAAAGSRGGIRDSSLAAPAGGGGGVDGASALRLRPRPYGVRGGPAGRRGRSQPARPRPGAAAAVRRPAGPCPAAAAPGRPRRAAGGRTRRQRPDRAPPRLPGGSAPQGRFRPARAPVLPGGGGRVRGGRAEEEQEEGPPDPLAARDRWGRTPLHWAVVNGHGDIVKLLVELGASKAERDGAGETPLEIAERRAQCGAQDRPNGARASTWGGIARALGGAGTTQRGRELRGAAAAAAAPA